MLTFKVPPGIGDFSAMYSKMSSIKRDIQILVTRDGPSRLIPFLQILPNIKSYDYGMFGTMITLEQTLPPGTDLASLPDGEYWLSINNWLERGGSVDRWVPGPTDYHFPMNIEPALISAAQNTLSKVDTSPMIGIYTSAYGNARHWGFWGPQEWFEFLKQLRTFIPSDTVFIFIGAEFDLGISAEVYAMCQAANIPSLFTVGDFHIGSTIEVIRHLDYFFAFPSGLGFLADVVNTPSLMWLPGHLMNMKHTFTDPINNTSGRTLHEPYMTPQQQAHLFNSGTGRRFFEERLGERVHAKNLS